MSSPTKEEKKSTNGPAAKKSAQDDPSKDFYALLGVEKSATEAQIKTSYRKLALKYHPDRNPGDHALAEKFKEISVAYAVLSDPNKRRQYDLAGPSSAITDFEGVDVDQLGGLGRVFGALFTKLGVPIPTQITPKVLGTAKDIIDCRLTTVTQQESSSPQQKQSTTGGSGGAGAVTSATQDVEELKPGVLYPGRVDRQEAKFYKIRISESDVQKGVVVVCRSPSMSKFKLILFDKEGGVRQIEESAKRGKQFTTAEMYFVPFDHMQNCEFFPMKFFMESDKEVPPMFHLLDTFENSQNLKLEPREHLLAVYGDNWLQSVKFQLRWMVAESNAPAVTTIVETEKKLTTKKEEMAQFQTEFMEAKRRFEAAVERLQMETKDIVELMQNREKAYEEFLEVSGAKYSNNNVHSPEGNNDGGLFKGIFSSVTNVWGGSSSGGDKGNAGK